MKIELETKYNIGDVIQFESDYGKERFGRINEVRIIIEDSKKPSIQYDTKETSYIDEKQIKKKFV